MFENIHGKMLNLPSTLRIMSKVTAAALQVPSPGPSARPLSITVWKNSVGTGSSGASFGNPSAPGCGCTFLKLGFAFV